MAEDSTPWSQYREEGYRSDMHVSSEYKINRLTRMLAGYDDATWDRLRADRKRTYERAASMLFHGFPEFVRAMQDMNAMPTFHAKGRGT